MTHDNPEPAARERLAAHYRARAAGDDGAINATIRDAAKAADADLFAQARAAMSAAYADLPDDADGASVIRAEADAWHRLPRAVRMAALAGEGAAKALPVPVAVPAITGDMPRAILKAAGLGGAILAEGAVAVLSGEGGIAKSALAATIAHDMAALADDARDGTLCDSLFEAATGGGPALILAYEDPATVIAWKLRELSGNRATNADTLNRVHVLDMLGWPLFGPGERNGAAGLYNAAPEPLAGWDAMRAAVNAIRPRIVIIDPTMAAFGGDANAAGPVRAFLSALADLAREFSLGVLVIAHSRKDARGNNADVFDPGQIAGSTHWTDGVRGAMTMQWKPDDWEGQPGDRILAVAKANWGPGRGAKARPAAEWLVIEARSLARVGGTSAYLIATATDGPARGSTLETLASVNRAWLALANGPRTPWAFWCARG